MTNLLTDFPKASDQQSGWPWLGPLPQTADPSLPKISVITFSHNQTDSLEATIRSVLLQGYPNLEYIVIDGGSNDGSIEIIQKYERWITHWSSAADPVQAITEAFSKASGDVISWLNVGDLYAPEAMQVAAMRLTNVPKGLLVGSTIIPHHPDSLDGEIVSRWPIWEKMLYETTSFPQASVFWTCDLWNIVSVKLTASPNLALDYYLWLQLFFHANTFIPEAIVLSYSRNQPQRNDEHLAYAAIIAAKHRGENLIRFLINLWLYRVRLAVWKRKPKMLIGSQFHQMVTNLAFLPHRINSTG